MALPDNTPFPAYLNNAAGPEPAPQPIAAPVPRAALARLPDLHHEARIALRRAGFVARAVPAAGLLLAIGVVVALAGGAALAPTFVWSLLMLLGIGAILRHHISGAAGAFAQNLAGSAADLRAILLYVGFAWGAGAFLALSPAPLPLVIAIFATVPCAIFVMLLDDMAGILVFAAPVTGLSLIAALARGRPVDAVAILFVQGAIGIFVFKHRDGATSAPAGLVLH